MIHRRVVEFINRYSDLIDIADWDMLYRKASTELDALTGLLTDALLDAGINPLLDLSAIPEAYYFGGNRPTIEIPSHIHTINLDAFGDSKITKLNFPESLCKICSDCFNSSSITELDLTHTQIKLAYNGFCEGCQKLTSVYLPGSLEKIPDYAFNRCGSLREVELAEGIKSISTGAFAGCHMLDELHIPESVTYIANRALPDHTDILCFEGSYAHEYAIAKDRHYKLV